MTRNRTLSIPDSSTAAQATNPLGLLSWTDFRSTGLDKPLHSILVTSCVLCEGKSITAVNMALDFARAGNRVCLVDADLRQPQQADLLGVENWPGLSTVLKGRCEVEAALCPTEHLGLTVLPSGPPLSDPQPLLASWRMSQLLRELETEFDTVVQDAPPVLAAADATMLASQVGGVVLVSRCDTGTQEQLFRAWQALVAARANLVGMVITGSELPSQSDLGIDDILGRRRRLVQ